MSLKFRALFATVIVGVTLTTLAPPAAAHTGFESSVPGEGSTVEAGLDVITITFTNEAAETGEGFVVLDPAIGLREPTQIENPSVGVFVLSFEPAISPGDVGVRWTVKAPDAHPIDGSFQFTVSEQSAANDPAPDEPATTDTIAPADDVAVPELDEFLASTSTSTSGRVVSDIGRFLSMAGMMIALGFIIFAVTVMRGTRAELRMLLFWIRRAAIVTFVGTLLDAVGQVVHQAGVGMSAALERSAYVDTLWTSLGFALVLRLASSATVAAGARISMVHAHEARDVLRPVSAAVPIGAGSTRIADHPPDYWEDHDVAWDIDRHGIPATAGFALMLFSHSFDGHTVTEGNRMLTGLASAAHVLAAAVWVGGVVALALIIRRRSKTGEPTHALILVTRYSVVATVALAVVAVMGIYLARVILDAPSDIWATAWGRLLVAKTVVVAVAAALGAHNHHVIVPALEVAEDDDTVHRLQSTLRNEVIALIGVTVLTALLVQAASNLG